MKMNSKELMTVALKSFPSWSHQKAVEQYSSIHLPYGNFATIWYTESDSSSNIQLKQVHIIFSYLDKLRLRIKTQFFYFLNAFASLKSIPKLFRAFFKAGNMYRDGLHVDKLQLQVFHDGKPVCPEGPKGHGLMSILSDPLNMDLNIQAKHMMLVSFQNLHWQNELNLRYSIFLHKN